MIWEKMNKKNNRDLSYSRAFIGHFVHQIFSKAEKKKTSVKNTIITFVPWHMLE